MEYLRIKLTRVVALCIDEEISATTAAFSYQKIKEDDHQALRTLVKHLNVVVVHKSQFRCIGILKHERSYGNRCIKPISENVHRNALLKLEELALNLARYGEALLTAVEKLTPGFLSVLWCHSELHEVETTAKIYSAILRLREDYYGPSQEVNSSRCVILTYINNVVVPMQEEFEKKTVRPPNQLGGDSRSSDDLSDQFSKVLQITDNLSDSLGIASSKIEDQGTRLQHQSAQIEYQSAQMQRQSDQMQYQSKQMEAVTSLLRTLISRVPNAESSLVTNEVFGSSSERCGSMFSMPCYLGPLVKQETSASLGPSNPNSPLAAAMSPATDTASSSVGQKRLLATAKTEEPPESDEEL